MGFCFFYAPTSSTISKFLRTSHNQLKNRNLQHTIETLSSSFSPILRPISYRNCTFFQQATSPIIVATTRLFSPKPKTMQTQIAKFIPVFFTSLILFSGLLLTSCDPKDELIPTPIEEEVQYPDPIDDLVAYLSSSLGVLFVDPAYLEEVIELLGLAPRTDGLYEYSEVTPDGEVRTYLFELVELTIPEVYFAAAPEMELETPPREVDGVWYRVWRNAECGEKVKKKTGLCEELPEMDPQTGAIARQHKIETEHKRCKQGKVLCPEKSLPIGHTYFYDKLCKDDDSPDGNEVDKKVFEMYRCDY